MYFFCKYDLLDKMESDDFFVFNFGLVKLIFLLDL